VVAGTLLREKPLSLGPPFEAGLGLDFHNHLLPHVDDGMANMAEALAAILELKALGFAGAVVTPHIYAGRFDNIGQGLKRLFDGFAAGLRAAGEGFLVFLAAEYFADEHFLALIQNDDLLYLPVGKERWVLLEFPYFQANEYTSICLAALAARGYRPVVAHVERYRFVAAAPYEWLKRFEQAGAVLQGDIGSLAGQHGEVVRRFAKFLAARELVAIWGTDLHKPAQLKQFIVPGLKQLGMRRVNRLLEPVMAEIEPCR
jgi:protein-tyrosine phosphatase